VFSILPGDRGRPITDLASRFSLPDLAEDVAGVLAGRESVERRVGDATSGAHYLVRVSPYRDLDRRTRGVVVSFVDVTGLTLAEDRQKVLIGELHHRTRNLLTVVQAIASLTLGKGGTMKSFTDRLAALGRAQELLGQQGGRDELDIGEVVRVELLAHPAAEGRVTVSGPAVPLGLERVQALALALHELATNAVKYGALGQEGGRLEIGWQVDSDATTGPAWS
jgi:two-component system CheB/CheR fusion protein